MNRTSSDRPAQNVHGWERAASLAGGLYLLGKGLRHGGLGGLFQLGIGALALARGISGRCAAKRVLQEVGEQAQNAVIDSSHMPLEQTPAERERLRSSAQAATSTVTVTGNQGLDSPPTNP